MPERLGTDRERVTPPAVPSAPLPEREGLGTSDRPEPPRNIYGLTDAELLDCLGPSWNEVAPHRRDFHPGYRAPTPHGARRV